MDEISARASRGLGFCGIENNFWKGGRDRERGRPGEREGKTNQKYGPTNPGFQFWGGEGGLSKEGGKNLDISLPLRFRLMASFLSSAE